MKTIREKVIYALKQNLQTKSNLDICNMNIEFLEKELQNVKNGGVTLVEMDDIYKIRKTVFDYFYMSPTEKESFKSDKIKYADKTHLQEKIDYEKSLKKHYESIIKIIDTSINALNQKEEFLIRLNYMSEIKYKWADIYNDFKRTFKSEVELAQVRRYNQTAIKKLCRTMGNSYIINLMF